MKKKLLKYPFYFVVNYIPNHIINKIPFYFIRHLYYKSVLGIKIGTGSSVHMNTFVNRTNIKIGTNSSINRNCYLDGRGGLFIGNNVSISPEVHLITASHDINSESFEYFEKSIKVDDFVWIGTRATILPGVNLKKGCVVASGSVVTKDVSSYDIVAGVPAKVIGKRNEKLNYNCKWFPPFD
ncbi:acyltransferase [Jejuia pallidilutea]|jgi:maltose O-acetyltransferase|uniref:Maltose O-acetyltransferase n=1 Tax=Jejuia pallidilutea TaxID=504487 RepID=A0A098LRT8_9FLAO|nr:acyltransferase [Jejuia pallidilutea]GAL89119.1 maltose O-acetyltransferase [Jejuia pallidilutea]